MDRNREIKKRTFREINQLANSLNSDNFYRT